MPRISRQAVSRGMVFQILGFATGRCSSPRTAAALRFTVLPGISVRAPAMRRLQAPVCAAVLPCKAAMSAVPFGLCGGPRFLDKKVTLS